MRFNPNVLKKGPNFSSPHTFITNPNCIVTDYFDFLGLDTAEQQQFIVNWHRVLNSLQNPLQITVASFRKCSLKGLELRGVNSPEQSELKNEYTIELDDRLLVRRHSYIFVPYLSSDRDSFKRMIGERLGITCSSAYLKLGLNIDEKPSFLKTDGIAIRCFYVNSLAPAVHPGWLSEILCDDLDTIVSLHITPLTREYVLRVYTRRLHRLTAQTWQYADMGLYDPLTEIGLPALKDLGKQIASGDTRMFEIGFYIATFAPSIHELDKTSKKLIAKMSANLIRCYPALFQMSNAFLSCLPLGQDQLHITMHVDTNTLGSLLPWTYGRLDEKHGIPLGRTFVFNLPVSLQVFNEAHSNFNIAVIGHSGAGKSYLMKGILTMSCLKGTKSVILDPENEYLNIYRKLGGQYFNVAEPGNLSVNVLLPYKQIPTNFDLEAHIVETSDILEVLCGGFSQNEKSSIQSCLYKLFSSDQAPLLSDLIAELQEDDEAHSILKPLRFWASGLPGQLFNRPTSFDLNANPIVFGLRDLNPQIHNGVMFILASSIWTIMRCNPSNKLLVIDELGLLFYDIKMRQYIASLARRARKYRTSLLFGTQNALDLLATDEGKIMGTNAGVVLLGQQKPVEALSLSQSMGITDRQRSFLETAARGDFLLLVGGKKVQIKVEFPSRVRNIIEG